MKSFFKMMFATMLGTFLTLLVFFFILVGIIGSIASMAEKEQSVVKNNSILHIKLDNALVEREPKNPLADFNFSDEMQIPNGLDKIMQSIKYAATDDKIKGIYLESGMFLSAGYATLTELRNAIIDFKKSGKFIYSYAEVYTQKAYFLASACDKVYLNPAGTLELSGLNVEVMFFKNALDKFNVNVQVIRGSDNKFKSAVEPFMLDKMSQANREQLISFTSDIWGNLIKDISGTRPISVKQINDAADSLSSFNPEKAVALGLVDKLIYLDELYQMFMDKLKVKKIDDLEIIDLGEYSTTVKRSDFKEKDRIAVIYASGEIQSGVGDDEVIGSETLCEAIKDARTDDKIKAIVLRVNSPGGSALASEMIWRELILAKKSKPVIVSMGDYAASGGYYIACMANKIVAQPTTLTGSIGVFGIIPNFQEFLAKNIGITTDRVGTNANSDISSVLKPLSPFQFASIQGEVNRIYTTFITHVAEGRNLSVAQVDSIGQGRIWSGIQAQKLGLVDELGGIDKAIAIAASEAKIKTYKTVYFPEQKSFFETFFKKMDDKTMVNLKKELGSTYKFYEYLQSMQKLEGTQMRLPFFAEIN